MRAWLCLLPVLVIVQLAGCGDDGEPNDVGTQTCTATLRVLQKDAYKDTAGPLTNGWPPHTTTELEVACDGELAGRAVQANHGTTVGQTDANGNVFLHEVKAVEADGRRGDLLALLDAYETCSCDAGTKFLGLDTLQQPGAQALLSALAAYIEANLHCEGATIDELVGLLSQGDVSGALAILPACSWISGTSVEQGFDQALSGLAAQTNELLADYHVCNNDATLQKQLFDEYARTAKVHACDAFSAVCHGPKWLYTP